jgi:hypothetical protein
MPPCRAAPFGSWGTHGLSLCPWPPIMRLPIYNRRRGRGGLGVGAGAVVVRFRAGGRSESETARCCARLGGYGRGRVRLVVGVSVSVWAAWHRLAGVRGAALAMRHWRRCQAGLGWGGVGSSVATGSGGQAKRATAPCCAAAGKSCGLACVFFFTFRKFL